MRPLIEYLETITTLLAVVEPLGLVPLFLAMTAGMSSARRAKFAATACGTMLAVLSMAVLAGERLFGLMGISVASFRVGGGIVLLLIAIRMLFAPSEEEGSPAPAAGRGGNGAVPLGVPLLAGPGSITAALIQSQAWSGALDTAILLGCLGAVALVSFVVLVLAAPLERWLGKQGLDVIGRLAALVLAALAVEFVASGLAELFPQIRVHGV